MAGCVCNDKLALGCGKESVGHVNGDTLFAFGNKSINQQSKIDIFTLCTVLF